MKPWAMEPWATDPWATWGSSREKPPVEAAASTGRSQQCPTQPHCAPMESIRVLSPPQHPQEHPKPSRPAAPRCHLLVTASTWRWWPWPRAGGQTPPPSPRAAGPHPRRSESKRRGWRVAPHRGLLPCPAPSSPAWVLAGAGTGVCRGTGGSRRGAEPGPRASSIEHMICCGSFPAAWSQPRASTDDGFNCFQIR